MLATLGNCFAVHNGSMVDALFLFFFFFFEIKTPHYECDRAVHLLTWKVPRREEMNVAFHLLGNKTQRIFC